MLIHEGIKLLTVSEVAELREVKRDTVYKAVQRGAIPSVELLGHVLVSEGDAMAYQVGSYDGAEGRVKKRRGPGRGKSSGAGASTAASSSS